MAPPSAARPVDRPRADAHRDRAGAMPAHYDLQADLALVTDFDFAAYLSLRGAVLVEAVRVTNSVHHFYFRRRMIDTASGPVEEVKQLSIDFANSESARFADAVRRIKRILYSARDVDPRTWRDGPGRNGG